MDAVENCLKAIENYNLETATRTASECICIFHTDYAHAFLRRIEKEKKQQDIKLKYLTESGLELLVAEEIDNNQASRQTQAFVDELRERIDLVKHQDSAVKDYSKAQKQTRKKRTRQADSDLTEHFAE